MTEGSPHIGIVVPVFGHSRLAAEALASVWEQVFAGRISTVVVIDGDPAIETIETVRTFLRGGDNPVHALFQGNGRLPKARNTGIRFLLNRYTDLDAIYLLDADNRLQPRSIAAFWQCLCENPDAAWAYPDIGFFGMAATAAGVDFRVTAPRYSVIRHLMGNISEAGSMVRAEVFRRGILFDETFNRGYEDWEYWLQCLEAGLIGARVPDAGFQYRRRPNSMLADADLVSEEIKYDIYTKHKALFSADFVGEQFCRECAPYFYVPESGDPVFLSADGRLLAQGKDAIAQLIQDAVDWPHWPFLPRFVVVPLGPEGNGPRPKLETYFELLDRLKDEDSLLVDDQFSPVDSESGAKYAVYNFGRAAGLSRSSTRHQDELGAADQIAAEIDKAQRRNRQRRYAGPAAFQIDTFVRNWVMPNSSPVAPPAPQVSPSKSRKAEICLIEPSRNPGSCFWLGPLSAAGKVTPRPDLVGPLSSLDVNDIQYRGMPVPYSGDTHLTATPGDRYEYCVISEEYRLLVHATDFRRLSDKVVFAMGPRSSAAELYAVAASEHALNAVLCGEDQATTLRALGLPARKLVTPPLVDTYFARH